MSELLSLKGLEISFYSQRPEKRFKAVCSAGFSVKRGEILGFVGESGCGKSLTVRALLDLLPETALAQGRLVLSGEEYSIGSSALKTLRGRRIGMVFQEPMSALNPVYTAGYQAKETLAVLGGYRDDKGLKERACELFERVGLENPEVIFQQYPHQLSGGQKQRVLIALALAGEPELLVADEPATALDAPLRKKIIKLLKELARGGLSIIFVSHDLGLVSRVCDRAVVMYSGYTVENCRIDNGRICGVHPYTGGLTAISRALNRADESRLPVIPGEVPEPRQRPSGCPFYPRCDEALENCKESFPEGIQTAAGVVYCWARQTEVGG